MIYLTAAYANADHTQVTGTDADGNSETVKWDYTLFRQDADGPLGFEAAGGDISEYVEPVVEPQGYKLYKSTLIRRLTENEAIVLTALLAGSPVKSQMLWNASEWLSSVDPLFVDLTTAIASVLGQKRAGEILAEEP